ncbi:MAG: phosphohistidine phosphatase [Hyphobacterium sp.]|nr:MAG: phosphohistidine phosphatase [Hyphobacterium sp.]
MPRLILVRHARAVDRMDADDDFERGLTPDGRDTIRKTAEQLRDAGIAVDLVLVSPAQRTMQSFVAMREALGNPAFEDPMTLYHASPEMLFRAALETFERADNLMIVGHNPGIGALAQSLAERAGKDADMPDGFPTSVAVVFQTDSVLDQISVEHIIQPDG